MFAFVGTHAEETVGRSIFDTVGCCIGEARAFANAFEMTGSTSREALIVRVNGDRGGDGDGYYMFVQLTSCFVGILKIPAEVRYAESVNMLRIRMILP